MTALTDIEDAKNQGSQPKVTLPKPSDLKELAKRENLGYDLTPMLSHEEAERYGQISGAEIGLTRLTGGRKFADEFFDPKTSLFEPEELTDTLGGRRYLARKIKDVPPRVPPLEEVRSQVSLDWKMNKARPLAQKAAEKLAEQLKKKGGTIKDNTVEGYRVLTIPLDRAPKVEPALGPIRATGTRRDADPGRRSSGRRVPQRLLLAPKRLGHGRT